MTPEPVFAYAQINARMLPLDRGGCFEDPLSEALAGAGLGEVTGGGTVQARTGEIEYCGIDVNLFDVARGVPFVCDFLAKAGAPRGSKLQCEGRETPFGVLEGLAIYLNGTDLPDEVYAECDVNFLYEQISQLLADRGLIQGYWQGPTETALYLYGHSVDEMTGLIAGFVETYPLCQRARLVAIA